METLNEPWKGGHVVADEARGAACAREAQVAARVSAERRYMLPDCEVDSRLKRRSVSLERWFKQACSCWWPLSACFRKDLYKYPESVGVLAFAALKSSLQPANVVPAHAFVQFSRCCC